MEKLKLGTTLWWVDREKNEQGTVIVTEVAEEYFAVLYKGKKYKRQYSVLNKKLFFEPQLTKKSCDNCFGRISGHCSSLANVVCGDYRLAVTISKEEAENWPEFGDASAYRMRNRRRFRHQ